MSSSTYSPYSASVTTSASDAMLNNNGSQVIANSGQGSYGNQYNVIFYDKGDGSFGIYLAADGKSVVCNINGVTDNGSYGSWIDNNGINPADTPHQGGAFPNTFGVYFPYGSSFPIPDPSPKFSTLSLNGFDFQCFYPGNAGNLCNVSFIDSGTPGDYHVHHISDDLNSVVIAVPFGESNLTNMQTFVNSNPLSETNLVFADVPAVAVTQQGYLSTFLSGGISVNLSGGGGTAVKKV